MANLLTNGDFSSVLTNWAQSPSGCAVVTSGEAVLTGDPGGTVQLYQHGFGVTDALSYKVTFTARGAVGGEVLRAQLVRHSSAGTIIGLDQNYTLTSSNATYATTFSCTLTEADARLRFRMSNTTNVVYIDNVVLELATSITAGFTGTPTSGTAPTTVTFTNESTGTPTGYSWEYSKDGGAWTEFSTSSGNPTHNFTDTGTYSIRLTVTKAAETDILTRSDYIVVSGAIVAGFTGTPLSGAITLNVTFTDASTSTNGITSREWFYNRNGAGWTSFSTSTNPVYGFTLGGSYDIRLVVEGPDGTSNLDRLAYVTATGGVVAGFTGTPLSGNAPLTVAFTDASGGTIVTRTWEYSRNGGLWTEFSSATNPSFQFNSAGTYDIRLTVTGSSTSDTLLRSAYIVVTGTNTIAATIYDETGASVGTLLSTFAFQAETDYFITVSYDQATGLAILYVDGAEVANENIGSYNMYTSGQIQVGQVGGLFHSNILLDELFFLNRAINPDEVRAVYESNAPVFAETSTWHWRAGRNRLWADTEGLWMVNASGTKVLGAYAGDEDDPNAFKTWGGVNLYESDVLIGDASRAGWMQWDDSAGTLEVHGKIFIAAGSEGYASLDGIPASLADLDPAADTKLDGIEANATVGATVAQVAQLAGLDATGVLVSKVIPASTIGNPGVAGLYLGSDKMGYHTGNGASSGWKTYMDSSGNMLLLGNASNNYIQWVAASNKLQGVGGGIEQWYADATTGKLLAGAGNVQMSVDGLSIIGDDFLRLYEDVSTLKGYLYSSNPLDSLLVNSTGLGLKTNGGATAESVSLRANSSSGRAAEIAIEGTNSAGTNRIRALAYSGSGSTSSQLTLSESEFSLAIGNTAVTDFSIDASGNVTFGGAIGGTWTALSYNSGWTDLGGSYQIGQYKKVGDLVFLRGVTTRTSGSSTQIATLPSGYRPPAAQIFAVAASGAFGYVDIASGGSVVITSGNPWVSLDGIVFSTAS